MPETLVFLALDVAGLVILGSGTLQLYRTRLLVRRGSRARGVIVAIEQKPGGDGRVSLNTIEFGAADGRYVRFEDLSSWSQKTGHEADVVYDPRAPEQARQESDFTLWFFPALQAFVGAGWVLVSFVRVLSGLRDGGAPNADSKC